MIRSPSPAFSLLGSRTNVRLRRHAAPDHVQSAATPKRSSSAARHGRGKSLRNEGVVYSLHPRLNPFDLVRADHLVCALLVPRSDLNHIAPLAMALPGGADRRVEPSVARTLCLGPSRYRTCHPVTAM
jgi:hypothetical protein